MGAPMTRFSAPATLAAPGMHAPHCRTQPQRAKPALPEESQMLKGSMVALITPMRADGSLDEKAFSEFVDWQISEGTEGLIPVATTGESPTLSHDEHKRIVEICVETTRGRVPVIAGAGSNSTAEA